MTFIIRVSLEKNHSHTVPYQIKLTFLILEAFISKTFIIKSFIMSPCKPGAVPAILPILASMAFFLNVKSV